MSDKTIYTISCERAKRTYVWGEKLAGQVSADYTERFGEGGFFRAKDINGEEDFHLDHGGMLMTSMPHMIVEADGFRLGFYADQASEVEDTIKRARDRSGYVKLHGHWNCLCIPTELSKQLLIAVQAVMPEAKIKSDTAFAEWQKKFGKPDGSS